MVVAIEKNTEIQCPSCGHAFDIQDVIKAGAKDLLHKELLAQDKKYKAELDKINKQKEKLEEKHFKQEQEIKAELEKKHKADMLKKEQELKEKINEENKEAQAVLEDELKEKTDELKEMKKLKAEMSKLERDKASLEEDLALKFQKDLNSKLADEKTKLKQNLDSEHELEVKEYKKQIEDQKILVEEMKRKQEQGSMQLQGEVQELAIEAFLNDKFPIDTIEEIGKGDMGADCLQIVNTRTKLKCGTIYYESKRTKTFGNTWIEKFKEDIKEKKADIGVLVTQAYPKGMDRMGLYEGIYICSFNELKGLAEVLREGIIKQSFILSSQENRSEKAQLMYDFLTSNEFKLQAEGVLNAFMTMKDELEKEKSAYQRIWKRREKQLETLMLNTSGMIGSIDGIAGNELETEKVFNIPMIED